VQQDTNGTTNKHFADFDQHLLNEFDM